MRLFYKRLLSVGIAIGVFCALFVFTAGQTRISAIQERNKILGTNIYKIVHKPEVNTLQYMSMNLAKQIQEALPKGMISDVIGFEVGASITYKEEPISGGVTGTGSNYDEVMKLEFVQGRYFTQEELEQKSNVCIVKSSLYNLLGEGSASDLTIQGEAYNIIGVVKDNSRNSNGFMNENVYIPIMNLYKDQQFDLENSGLVSKIIFNKGKYSQAQLLKTIQEKVQGVQIDTSELKLLLNQEDEFSSNEEVIKILLLFFIVSLLILFIACFNIIHIATASVIDREREIGLRTALGAGMHHIVRQILREITACAIMGGILGIAIAGIFNTVFNYQYKHFVLSFNLLTVGFGLVLATVAGLLATVIPASKAAKLDPIAALREE